MTEQDILRRVERLKLRRTLSDKAESYLQMQVEDATSFFLNTTHRIDDPGQTADSLICRIAVVWCNQEGGEGSKKTKDGEFEREYSEQYLPIDIEKELKTWRLVVGIAANSE